MSEPPVLLEVADGIAQIVLNRPSKYNALSLELAIELAAAVSSIGRRTDVGVILLRANGRSFCAGGDVVAMAGAPDRGKFLTELANTMHSALQELEELPIVTIVAVTGIVAGGGLGVMMAGDLVIAGDDATFASAYAGVGLTPDCGVSKNLPAWIGLQRALQLTVGGHKLDAIDALGWGLVGEVVPVSEVLPRARELAFAVLASAPQALGRTRTLIRQSLSRDLASSMTAEAEAIAERSASNESRLLIEKFSNSRAKKL